ncbi:MAG: hypothetical protein ABR502_00810 [Chitinophagaceae bacterium]
MTQNRFKPFFLLIFLFIIVNAFSISGFGQADEWNLDTTVLGIGNIIIFLITMASYIVASQSLKSSNPNVFVRTIMGSIMVKLFLCFIVAFIYIAKYKSNVNKPALFICMALYLIYTFMEVSVLSKLLKQQKANG